MFAQAHQSDKSGSLGSLAVSTCAAGNYRLCLLTTIPCAQLCLFFSFLLQFARMLSISLCLKDDQNSVAWAVCHTCSHMWKPELNFRRRSSHTISLETASLMGPGTHQYCWPASPKDPPLFAFQVLRWNLILWFGCDHMVY